MKKLGQDTFNERLKQTMFENPKPKQANKFIPKYKLSKTNTISNIFQKWLRPRKMRKSEKFALASLLTYVVYMMQMAKHF